MQIRLSAAGIDHRMVKLLAITHTHGDHIHGLLPFIESLELKISTQKEKKAGDMFRLKIVAPESFCKYLGLALGIIKGEGLKELDVVCIEAKKAYMDGNGVETPGGEIKVVPIPTRHGVSESYGYYVALSTRRRVVGVFYSGDGVCENVCKNRVKQLKPLIVIHEATFLDYPEDRVKAYEKAHATLYEASTLANDVGASALVLTHISTRYDEEDLYDFVSRARRLFRGDIFIAKDLAKIPLNILSNSRY